MRPRVLLSSDGGGGGGGYSGALSVSASATQGNQIRHGDKTSIRGLKIPALAWPIIAVAAFGALVVWLLKD